MPFSPIPPRGLESQEWNGEMTNLVGDRAAVRVVLLGDDGEELPPGPGVGSADRHVLRETGQWLTEQVEHAREFHASPGPRLGPAEDTTQRRGTSEEVLIPLAIPPRTALALATEGQVLHEPLGALVIEPDPARHRAAETGRRSWSATLHTGRVARRAATLRLRPSPSNRLTLIELVPTRAPHFRTDAFVRAGVPAVRELGTRLAHAAATRS